MGGETASLAVSRQVSKVAELCAGHRGYTSDDGGGGGGRKRNKRGRKLEPGPDASPKPKKKLKVATPESGKRFTSTRRVSWGPMDWRARRAATRRGRSVLVSQGTIVLTRRAPSLILSRVRLACRLGERGRGLQAPKSCIVMQSASLRLGVIERLH